MSGQPAIKRFKGALAKPWNSFVKKWLKKVWAVWNRRQAPAAASCSPPLKPGDQVRVRSRQEIEESLDAWMELKGCAFLEGMWQYCGTTQRVLQPMERFLDERDYRVKKCRGIILLENVICRGTPVFGRCDRCCFLFWREEWLERLPVER